ncbi:hypothetical protein Y032_0178g641 [Ancylostoma ceylanicum]|uniref:Uncharacterized protein n=1 Tax=Ancylostoma ceylanicum TaxID=53326 RepID=A0A016STY7_9BILA|nr:hypothetical protein Y032_0178g641 [Ancylostoma ceylanicum]
MNEWRIPQTELINTDHFILYRLVMEVITIVKSMRIDSKGDPLDGVTIDSDRLPTRDVRNRKPDFRKS